MEKNLGDISPTDRCFYLQNKDFVDRLKIYRRICEVLWVLHSPTPPPLATPLGRGFGFILTLPCQAGSALILAEFQGPYLITHRYCNFHVLRHKGTQIYTFD